MAADESGARKIDQTSGREFRVAVLSGVIRDAAAALARLGKAPEAWRRIAVQFNGTDAPGVGYGTAALVALGKKEIRRIEGHGRPAFEEVAAYRHAKAAAIAHEALTHIDDPSVMYAAGGCIERYRMGEHIPAVRRAALRNVRSKDGIRGGRHGKGKSKRRHTELFRCGAALLKEHGQPATPARVRGLLKLRWREIAFEMGDPLSEIVNVNVRGSVIGIEYTKQWKKRLRRGSAFVEVDEDALKKALRPRARRRPRRRAET